MKWKRSRNDILGRFGSSWSPQCRGKRWRTILSQRISRKYHLKNILKISSQRISRKYHLKRYPKDIILNLEGGSLVIEKAMFGVSFRLLKGWKGEKKSFSTWGTGDGDQGWAKTFLTFPFTWCGGESHGVDLVWTKLRGWSFLMKILWIINFRTWMCQQLILKCWPSRIK